MRADLPASLDPEPGVFEVQQRVLRGPQRPRVLELGSTDREKTRVRRRLQLRPDGYPGRGVAETRGWRWSGTSIASRSGRRSSGSNDGGGGGGSGCGRPNFDGREKKQSQTTSRAVSLAKTRFA